LQINVVRCVPKCAFYQRSGAGKTSLRKQVNKTRRIKHGGKARKKQANKQGRKLGADRLHFSTETLKLSTVSTNKPSNASAPTDVWQNPTPNI